MRNERGRGTRTEEQVEKTKEGGCKLKLRLTQREGMRRTAQLPREAERDRRIQSPAEREGDRRSRHGAIGGRRLGFLAMGACK